MLLNSCGETIAISHMYFVSESYLCADGACCTNTPLTNITVILKWGCQLLIPRTYKPWIGNSLLKLLSYSERSQNAGFHPRSHHLVIVQTRPSPPMLGFVDKVLARL